MAEVAPSKPAYVLVGGVSHTPVFWERVMSEFLKVGVDSKAVAFPTCGENTEGKTQWDEVRAIQNTVLEYVDRGNRDVVLVAHSYGGWPASRAVKVLDKETRIKEGKKTGIIEVVFIAAFLLPDNAPMSTYSFLPDWLTSENGVRIPNEKAIPVLFSHLDEKTARAWLGKFEPMRNAFHDETVPNAPWHLSVPKTYIVITDDNAFNLPFQLLALKEVIDETWSIKTLKGGHEPFINVPENLTKVILAPTY